MKNVETILTGGDETGVSGKNRCAKWRGVLTDYLGLGLALIGLIAVFSLSSNHFFSPPTFRTIANQIPDAVIVAVGMTFVIIIGGIDLSVGSVLALSGAALGLSLANLNLPLPVAIVCCLCVGLICGAINGVVTIRWSLPSFIVTLGMLEVARGGAYLATNSQTLYIGGAVERIAEISLFGLSLPFLVAVLIVVAGQITLSRTVFGRYMLAIGANEEVARYSGINPRPIKLAVFALCGLLTGVAAVFHSSRLSSANPNAGIGFELQAIAAVVIGGTSLMGGRGSVINTFFGVLIIAVLGTGLAQVGAQESTKRLVTGLVIVAAVIIDHYRRQLETSRGKSK
jgi:ribose transport system permease protein